MRVIIAGSRDGVEESHVLYAILLSKFEITTVISGTARGADKLGELVAKTLGLPIERYPAEWDRHGRAAGPIRNEQMAAVADAAIIIWDGRSKGSRHMIVTAKRRGLRVFVFRTDRIKVTGPFARRGPVEHKGA